MPNAGVFGGFAVGSANPIVAGATTGILLDILNESVGMTTGFIDGNGNVRGTRSRFSNRVREGDKFVGGSFSWHPVSADLSYMMQRIMGGGTATVPALTEVIPSFVIQKRTSSTGNRVSTYAAVYATRATFEMKQGQPLMATVEVIGTTAEAVGSSWPTISLDATTSMFIFNDLTLTIGGSAYACKDCTLTIDNAIVPQRVNNRIATGVMATDRIITISHNIPESDVLISVFQDVELSAVISLSYNNQSVAWTMPVVRYNSQTAHLAGREEVELPLTGQAFATAALNELTVAIDSTP